MKIPGDGRRTIPTDTKNKQNLEGRMVFHHTAFFFIAVTLLRSCNIQIHEDKVADASAHDKQMEHFVGAEGFML